MIVVDHVARHSVSRGDGWNELSTLHHLRAGLIALANQVALMESPLRDQEAASGRRMFVFGTPDSVLPPESAAVAPCFFHWYGVSLCNYVRLVGFLAGVGAGAFPRNATEDPANYKKIKEYCSRYAAAVPEIEPILVWRNKVFAHFAITDPRGDDNAALLDFSTMSTIGYSMGRLRVGGMTIMARGAECELPQWSVTESFEQLAPRYWPDMVTVTNNTTAT